MAYSYYDEPLNMTRVVETSRVVVNNDNKLFSIG